MADDQDARALLSLAAELPEDVQPPVLRLVERGRARRRLRATALTLTACGLAAAAIALPTVIGAAGPTGRPPANGQGGPQSPPPGPTATQLTRFRWSALPSSPLGPRAEPILTWTGHELLEVGGADSAGHPTSDGAAFDPSTRRWHLIAPIRANVGTANAVSTWTGRQLFLANGQSAKCALRQLASASELIHCAPTAGLYDPATNRWTYTPLPTRLRGLALTAAVWNGREIILAATGVRHFGIAVAAFDPATRHWKLIAPTSPAAHPPITDAMVATPRRVLFWSYWEQIKKVSSNSWTYRPGIDVLALSRADRWSTVRSSWSHSSVGNPAYGGGKILIPPGSWWCTCSNPGGYGPARLADARSLTVTTIPSGPLDRHDGLSPGFWLWDGAAALAATAKEVAGAPGTHNVALSAMAAYDPAARQWHMLSVPPGAPPVAADPLWVGRQVLLLATAGDLFAFHR